MMNEKQKQQRYDLCTRYLSEISKAESLMDLFNIHKQMWTEGLRHANIGPDEFGMFRTNDISSMKPSEVFLGNVYGLWTAPLNEWIGKSMAELNIRNKYQMTVVAGKDEKGEWMPMDPDQPLQEKMKLLAVVDRKNLSKLRNQ